MAELCGFTDGSVQAEGYKMTDLKLEGNGAKSVVQRSEAGKDLLDIIDEFQL
jgi:hypothetical protein